MYSNRWLFLAVAAISSLSQQSMAQSCFKWGERLPSARTSAAMAFDSSRNVAVLFGGQVGLSWQAMSDTWEWDGSGWHKCSGDGPSERNGHAIAYDSQRRVTVLFGGVQSSFDLGDTWEWDGAAWHLRSITGPSPRQGHAMAYDPLRGVTVLHGGFSSTSTWEWNGSNWTLRSNTGPGFRALHGMTFDSSRGNVIMFGGLKSSDTNRETSIKTNELWEWDGANATWTLLSENGPAPRSEHCFAYDSSRQSAVVFGGSTQQNAFNNDTWLWNSKTAQWTQIASGEVEPRRGASMVFDSSRMELVLHAGARPQYLLGDTHTLGQNDEQWRIRADLPFGGGHSAVFDSNRNVIVALSSVATWEWDGDTWHKHAVAGPSPATSNMAFDSDRGVVVMLSSAGETWEWDGKTWQVRATGVPSPRWNYAITYDAARKQTVLFGGTNSNLSGFDDTWFWDGVKWTTYSGPSPQPRHRHSMSYDSHRQRIVLQGGEAFPTQFYDTWEWNGQQWTLVTLTSPGLGHQSFPSMTFYPHSNRVVVAAPSGMWEWDGTYWELRSSPHAAMIGPHSFSYHAGTNSLYVFNNDAELKFWRFGATVACTGDLNGDGNLNAQDLLHLLGQWGTCSDGACSADFNLDGVVNAADLLILLTFMNM